MGVKWTEKQQQVIDLRERSLLVSAAAGSGKTAVLVERIIQKVLDKEHPVDIDHLLVVTFTKAAAAEMRERVAKAIELCMDAEPDNAYLNRQYTLVHHAQITTIDSFCLYVVKNYFQCIDLEPGFRVGDPGELSLLMEEVLEQVLEHWYEAADPAFVKFANDYANAKSDRPVADMVRKLYDYSQSYPWPEEWLEELNHIYEPGQLTAEALSADNSWLTRLIKYLKSVISGHRARLELAKKLCLEPDGPDMYLENIDRILEQMSDMDAITDYDELGLAIARIDFGRLAVRRGFAGDKNVQELVKKLRSDVKEELQKLYKNFFTLKLRDQLEALAAVGRSVRVLADVTAGFSEAYSRRKMELGLLDFSDIEHKALRILVDEQTKEPTEVAKEFQALFEEVMIDEYQDSNYVQEAILSAVSGGGGRDNRFMVGDVKQSIYRFRLARPELFMEKYDTYTLADSPAQKISLDQNFRSRHEVLDSVNDLFYRIMKRDVGGVEYDKEAALYPGADFVEGPAADSYKTKLLLADSSSEALEAAGADHSREQEARMIADEISRVMEEGRIADGAGGLRRVHYSDIVILLRSPGSWGDTLVNQLTDRGIPAHQMSQTGYFSASEVQTVLAVCQVIDNPLQDIPLAAALRSAFFDFTSEELAILRMSSQHSFFYDCLVDYAQNDAIAGKDQRLQQKTDNFLQCLGRWREQMRRCSVHDLLELLFQESGYMSYIRALPAGARRQANVEMLLEQALNYEKTSYKGLFSFIRYMQQLQSYEVDFGEADVTGENEDVVRIMSIHKSKGLEFPIVFVSGLGRRFNKRDSTDAMILDSTYGVGLTYVEGEKRRKSKTLLKQLIASRIETDNIGEELRVLYVALTRAKEQLILTGTLSGLEEKLKIYELKAEQEAAFLDRLDVGCYLDWILPGVYAHPEHTALTVVEPGDFKLGEALDNAEDYVGKAQLMEYLDLANTDQEGRELYHCLDQRLNAHYEFEEEIDLRTKISVSELKHRNMILEPGEEETLAWYAKAEKDARKEDDIPLFARQEGEADTAGVTPGALRGTAMHRMMELLDYEKLGAVAGDREAMQQELKAQLSAALADGRMQKEAGRLVSIGKIQTFLETALGRRIMQSHNSGKLFREQPFVMGMPAREADPDLKSEQLVLIQGIIDLYFEEAGEWVLVDYKTDSVREAHQLIDRYQTQMDLYARALTAATGRKVKEKLIYSFKLDQMIEL